MMKPPTTPTSCRIATRQSPLALRQAEIVQRAMDAINPGGLSTTLIPTQTLGDQYKDQPLSQLGGKGLFVKALEKSLLTNQADMAVHSMKDMTVDVPPELTLAAILPRAEPGDMLVTNQGQYTTLEDLPPGTRIGTSSLRRAALILSIRPDVQIIPLRGNINTRLKRLQTGDFDAIVLAAAGLNRLGLASNLSAELPPLSFLPAPAQGAIGIQCRKTDTALCAYVAGLNHPPTTVCIQAERAVSRALGGHCLMPLAAYATINAQQELHLQAKIGYPDGSLILSSQRTGSSTHPETLGQQVADDLRQQGADRIIQACQ